jgi:hypothetical protein
VSPFAFTVERPDCEAVIEHEGIYWPIVREQAAYDLCRRLGKPGFWRLRERPLTRRPDVVG